jgi:hypothetical protein
VNFTTNDPEAPVFPAVPPDPLAVALVSHCVVTDPQFAPVVVMFV